jgi:hypothetical protein
MEGNVWTQLSALAAAIASLLSKSSTEAPRLASPTSSSSAPGSPASSSSTSRTTPGSQSLLSVTRNPALQTTDAIFGDMAYNEGRLCATMERTAVAIPEGTYSGYKRDSQHFGRRVVGIAVPNRTDIECHPANWPCQLDGCIAVGESKDGDALDNSESAFERMMAALPESFTVEVSSTPQ